MTLAFPALLGAPYICDISSLRVKLKDDYSPHSSPPLDAVFYYVNAVHNIVWYFFTTKFNIIILST